MKQKGIEREEDIKRGTESRQKERGGSQIGGRLKRNKSLLVKKNLFVGSLFGVPI